MIDPRPELRSVLARWLVLRAKVRALADALTAREHGVRRDLRGSPDAAAAELLRDRLRAERRALDRFAADLDVRIADIRRQSEALEAVFVAAVSAQARSSRPALRR